jgi:hypothetical protein
MMHISGAAVAEIMVEFGQGCRQIGFSTPINDIEPFVAVCVIETKAIFVCGNGSGS